MATSEDVLLTGEQIYQVSIDLNEGWNLISGISIPLSVEEVYSHPKLVELFGKDP